MKNNNLLFAATLIGSSFLINPIFAANHHKRVHQAAASSEKSVGTVTMTFHSADLGVGYTWGDGVKKYI